MKARVSADHQLPLPPAVRQALSLNPGDVIDIRVEGDRLVLTKPTAEQLAELRALQSTLGEWLSPEDDDAFADL